MKKILIAVLLCPLLLLFTGCLTTLHPIFTVKELVVDSRLAGSWQKAGDNDRVTYRLAINEEIKEFSSLLQQNAGKIYIVTIRNSVDKIPAAYYAFLVKLGEQYYLDYYPFETTEKKMADTFFKAHYIPMHAIYRIDFSNSDSFKLKQLDGNYLEKLIRNKQIKIEHTEMEDGGYFITASTKELQQYLLKYGNVPAAYDNSLPSTYTKIK